MPVPTSISDLSTTASLNYPQDGENISSGDDHIRALAAIIKTQDIAKDTAIGLKANKGANSDITSLTGLTTPLTVAQGGTGAATLTANHVLLGNGTSTPQLVAPSTSGNVLTSNGTTWISAPPASTLVQYMHVVDAKPSGTSGGTSPANAWTQRTINAVRTNTITGASLSGSQVTLPAGTYSYSARATAFGVGRTRAAFFNVTDNVNVNIGISAFAQYTTSASSEIVQVSGRFTITGTKVFRVMHYTQFANGSHGFGVETNAGVDEVYLELEIWKDA